MNAVVYFRSIAFVKAKVECALIKTRMRRIQSFAARSGLRCRSSASRWSRSRGYARSHEKRSLENGKLSKERLTAKLAEATCNRKLKSVRARIAPATLVRQEPRAGSNGADELDRDLFSPLCRGRQAGPRKYKAPGALVPATQNPTRPIDLTHSG